MSDHVPFPRSASPLVVPTTSRPAAVAGIAMYAPCQRRSVLVRDVLWWTVRVLGPRALPAVRVAWPLPVEPSVWTGMCAQMGEALPGSWDGLAVYRRAADRPGATVAFIADGRQAAVARIEPEHERGACREVEALRIVNAHTPTTFTVPRVRAAGRYAGWAWTVTSPLRLGRHRMVMGAPVARVAEEIGAALADLPRPAGTPAHWRPFHGDFVPWNLRTTRSGGRALLDWESAGWAPPGADVALYGASSRAVARAPGFVWAPTPEVASYWRRAIGERIRVAREHDLVPDPLNRRILALLEQRSPLGV